MTDEFEAHFDRARSQVDGTQGPWRVLTIARNAMKPLFDDLTATNKILGDTIEDLQKKIAGLEESNRLRERIIEDFRAKEMS